MNFRISLGGLRVCKMTKIVCISLESMQEIAFEKERLSTAVDLSSDEDSWSAHINRIGRKSLESLLRTGEHRLGNSLSEEVDRFSRENDEACDAELERIDLHYRDLEDAMAISEQELEDQKYHLLSRVKWARTSEAKSEITHELDRVNRRLAKVRAENDEVRATYTEEKRERMKSVEGCRSIAKEVELINMALVLGKEK
jgi:hypothetical protein